MSMYKNLMTVCCAAVLALGLAACGSSDKTATPGAPPPGNGDPPAPPGPTPEETTKAAGTKAKAIGKVMVADPFDAVDVTVTAKRTGPEIKVERDDEFTHVMGPMYRLVEEADDDGNVVEQIVLVDHTITAPKRTSFEAAGHMLNENTDTTNDAGGVTYEALDLGDALASTDAANAMVLARVMADDFAAGAGSETTLTFDADVASTTDKNEAAEVDGTYDGAPGTYRCTDTTDCTVELERDAKGKVSITAMSDGWIFTPDDKAKVYVVDTEYASYGVWLQRTTDADGVLTYDLVNTFADGTDATANVTDVDGTASYKGSALGVYVHNVLDAGGEVASATSGMFTADAALTATFGQMQNEADPPQDTIAQSMLNTITGTIDNFELEGGEAQKWSVELARGAIDPDASTFSGATKGGGAEGEYNGAFRGATGDDNVAPSTVGGEFTANFLNGHVAGGFGATKQKD